MADIAKLVEDLSQLTVMEAAELAKALEEAWGVSAAAAVAASPAAKLSIHDADIPGMPAAQPDRRHDSPDPKTPTVFSFFEKVTATWQYVVADLKYGDAVVIDPVLDYDPASGNISTKTADGLLGFVWAHGLNVTRILYVLRSCVYV